MRTVRFTIQLITNVKRVIGLTSLSDLEVKRIVGLTAHFMKTVRRIYRLTIFP